MYFATSNTGKYEEVKDLLPSVDQLDIDLTEIQHVDHQHVVKDKARRAAQHKTPVFVEDTALHLDCLNGLPGPFIKWFLKRLQPAGIHKLCTRYNDHHATAATKIAYHNGNTINVFTGTIEGKIVEPRGEGFGWDPIFQPQGHEKTYAEMGEAKHDISHRQRALHSFTEWLDR